MFFTVTMVDNGLHVVVMVEHHSLKTLTMVDHGLVKLTMVNHVLENRTIALVKSNHG
jgi:hypothetical protein